MHWDLSLIIYWKLAKNPHRNELEHDIAVTMKQQLTQPLLKDYQAQIKENQLTMNVSAAICPIQGKENSPNRLCSLGM